MVEEEAKMVTEFLNTHSGLPGGYVPTGLKHALVQEPGGLIEEPHSLQLKCSRNSERHPEECILLLKDEIIDEPVKDQKQVSDLCKQRTLKEFLGSHFLV